MLYGSGPIAFGWTHCYNLYVTEAANGDITVYEEDGRTHLFTKSGSSYVHPAGVFETLVKNANGTFTLTRHNQVKVNYAALSGATAGKFTNRVDSNGNTVTPTYNASGELIEVMEASGRKLTFVNTGGRITQITDPLNRNFDLAYAAGTNDLATITFPDTKTIALAYDANHRITTLTNRSLQAWDYTYLADRLKAHYPGTMSGAVKEFIYGNPLTVLDQNGRKVENHRNASGELWKSIADPGVGRLNLTTTRTFDSQHNVLTATNPRGKVTTMTWDSNGNTLTITDPLNRVITMTYDARNNRLTLRDHANHLTTWEYSLQNNLTKTIDALSNQAIMTYDAFGGLLSVLFNGHTTNFLRDAVGNLTRLTNPLSQQWNYEYNVMGWQTKRIDALTRSTTYDHNDFGQVTLITYPDASAVTFEYDPEGNRTRVVDALTTRNYEYNSRNQNTKESHGSGPTLQVIDSETAYNDSGDATSKADATGDVTTLQYDAAGRLIQATRGADIVQYTLDANGNITRQDNPNGTYTELTYNDADQPTSIKHRKSDATIFKQFDLLYNSEGLISQVTELDGSVVTFGYDALHRLTSDVRTGTNPYNIAYTYDAAGNRLTRVKDGVTTNYAYDAADRMLTAGSDSYNWNANGALTSKVSGGVTTTFDWDFDDYMTKITQGATVVEFKYDGLKRRAQRIAGGATRAFLYSGDQIMVEKEGATLVAEYMLARGMIFREAGGVKETYHFDWIGSARALTDASQTVVATNNYEAFGSIVGSTGSSGNTYKYDGESRYRDDGDFGLLHVGARYYEAGTGRWMSVDPIREGGNWYEYARNNPINLIDPSGFAAASTKKRCFALLQLCLSGVTASTMGCALRCVFLGGPACVLVCTAIAAFATSACWLNYQACMRRAKGAGSGGGDRNAGEEGAVLQVDAAPTLR